MKPNPTRAVAGVVRAAALLGAIGGCAQGRPPGQSALFPSVAPSPPPAPPAPIDFRAGHVSVQCGSVTITARVPIPTPETRDTCDPTFAVELSVETNLDNAMLLDFLDLYVIADWRVHRTPEWIRHDLEVHWSPHLTGRTTRMMVHACPEGKVGPVLACSDRSCAEYSEVGEVPALELTPGNCAG